MKQKVLFVFAATLLLAAPLLRADDIPQARARAAAEMFFSKCGVETRASALTLLGTDLTTEPTRSGRNAAWYVFNRQGGGFVIISGMDAAYPVLGYSLEHTFCPLEEMPSHMKEWMDLYRDQINERRASGKPATEAELARWQEAFTLTRGETAPATLDLKTADWGQGSPFNRYCPIDSAGKRSIVGCVATAISEVMYFFKKPAHGTGTLPQYSKKGITVGPVELGEEYLWDKMLTKYKDVSYTDEQANAVATLCYHVGVMCKMGYSSSASSASTATGVEGLLQYMGYDKATVRHSRSYTSTEEWRALLRGQLEEGYPVLFAGNSGSAGHAFVVDGYDEAGRFLINFGWNASSNGYYQLDAFGSYTISQTAYLGVRPDAGGSYTPHFCLRPTTQSGVKYNGLILTGGTLATGSTFTLRFGAVLNEGYAAAGCKINFAHTDRNGNIKSMMRSSDISISSLSNGYFTWWSANQSLTVTKPIERGDKVVPMYRLSSDSNDWLRFSYNQDESFSPEIYMHLRDYTSLSYDKASGTFTLTTFGNTQWTLYDALDQQVDNGSVPASGSSFTLKCSDYPSGTYRLNLTLGTQTADITLTF